MRHMIRVGALVLMIGVAGPSAFHAAEMDRTPTESKIWELERSYLRHLQAADLESLGEFWHEEFVGWPSHAAAPVDSSAAAASLSSLLGSVRVLSFELHPQMIRVIGDLAVVHYLLYWELENADGTRSTSSYRITHTWLQEDGRWRIVAGMSSATHAG